MGVPEPADTGVRRQVFTASPDAGTSKGPTQPRLVRTTDAPDLGISATTLAGPLWKPAWRGVHVPHTADLKDPDVRLEAVGALLPDGAALGGWAALHARNVPGLDGRIGLTGKTRSILICVGPVMLMQPRSGLIIDRARFSPAELSVCSGVPVVSPERAICQIARHNGAEYGLAVADATCRKGVTTPTRLREFVATQHRRPGVPAMRLVAQLVDPRSASMPESHLRYVWVVLAGLPVPLVNPSLVDESGVFIGSPDLLDREAGVVGEYDGATHRGLTTHTNDNNREEGFENHDLIVVRATSLDVWPRRDLLVQRIQTAQRRGLARDSSRDAWGLRNQ
jgi:hypothetical protein